MPYLTSNWWQQSQNVGLTKWEDDFIWRSWRCVKLVGWLCYHLCGDGVDKIGKSFWSQKSVVFNDVKCNMK